VARTAPAPALVRPAAVLLAVCSVLALSATSVRAQDLFELEVFAYDTTPRGDFEVALHTNVMSRGSVATDSIAKIHRPTHISVEVTRGWTERFESAICRIEASLNHGKSLNGTKSSQ
jgi:hypothetical protein